MTIRKIISGTNGTSFIFFIIRYMDCDILYVGLNSVVTYNLLQHIDNKIKS
jgi:hypothetical protein